jgi:hypothetical protein
VQRTQAVEINRNKRRIDVSRMGEEGLSSTVGVCMC